MKARKMSDSRLGMTDAAASMANKATAGGAVTGFVGWLSQINWIGLSGVLIAFSGFAVSFYFQIQREKRDKELHEQRMRNFSAPRGDSHE